CPEEPDALPVGRPLHRTDLRREISLHVGHRATDSRVDLHVTLHELGLDRLVQLARDLSQDLGDGAPQGQRTGVDQLELDLDAQRGPVIGMKYLRRHDRWGSLFPGDGGRRSPTAPGLLGNRSWVSGWAASHASESVVQGPRPVVSPETVIP